MLNKADLKYAATVLIVLILGTGYFLYEQRDAILRHLLPQEKEVHVHADLAFFVDGQQLHFTDDRYQSSAESVKHQDIHFHDHIDHVIHRHANHVSLGAFFASIGIGITNTCLTLDAASYCTDSDRILNVYVNGQNIPDPATYVTQEGDRILIYYGIDDAEMIASLQAGVTADACIYSGTCPERGTPPPESCGITCEI